MRANNLPQQFFSQNSASLQELLNDKNSSLESIITSISFSSLWSSSNPELFSFIIDHCDELIEIGFQLKSRSRFSQRCLQIISSENKSFRKSLFSETSLLRFVYDYISHITSYPSYSQMAYFMVLPNIMFDPQGFIEPFFDIEYFICLFENVKNDHVYNFVLFLIVKTPPNAVKLIHKVEPAKIFISHITDENQFLAKRYQSLFIYLIGSKVEGNAVFYILDEIDKLLNFAIDNKNVNLIAFIRYIDNASYSKLFLSKWRKVHTHIVPFLDKFCKTAIEGQVFTSLSESCVKLSISIVLTNKTVTEEFKKLFLQLGNIFFVMKRNSFLHCCFLQSLEILISLKSINVEMLDEIDIFNKIIHCYENRTKEVTSCYWGHLRKISQTINPFVSKSQKVNAAKWNEIVVEKNKKTEIIISKYYGGFTPIMKGIKGDTSFFVGAAFFILFLLVLLYFLVLFPHQ